MHSDTATSWRHLYAAAAIAGAGLGLLVALGALPAIPHQVATWLRSFDDTVRAWLVSMIGGALVGLALATVAHLGVTWQLRRSESGPK